MRKPVAPQPLLDGDLHSLRVSGLRGELVFLVGPFRERVQGIADQVGRRLVTGIEQEDALVQQLCFGEMLTVFLAHDETRQDIGVRIA